MWQQLRRLRGRVTSPALRAWRTAPTGTAGPSPSWSDEPGLGGATKPTDRAWVSGPRGLRAGPAPRSPTRSDPPRGALRPRGEKGRASHPACPRPVPRAEGPAGAGWYRTGTGPPRLRGQSRNAPRAPGASPARSATAPRDTTSDGVCGRSRQSLHEHAYHQRRLTASSCSDSLLDACLPVIRNPCPASPIRSIRPPRPASSA